MLVILIFYPSNYELKYIHTYKYMYVFMLRHDNVFTWKIPSCCRDLNSRCSGYFRELPWQYNFQHLCLEKAIIAKQNLSERSFLSNRRLSNQITRTVSKDAGIQFTGTSLGGIAHFKDRNYNLQAILHILINNFQ